MVVKAESSDTEPMSDICSAFAEAVRRKRTAQGLSQEALAELAGINRTYIGSLERGKSIPSLRTAHRLAIALEQSLSDLIKECESVEPDAGVAGGSSPGLVE